MAAKAELKVHKKRAAKFYASNREVEEMSETEDVLGLTLDYMQNITPLHTTSRDVLIPSVIIVPILY